MGKFRGNYNQTARMLENIEYYPKKADFESHIMYSCSNTNQVAISNISIIQRNF